MQFFQPLHRPFGDGARRRKVGDDARRKKIGDGARRKKIGDGARRRNLSLIKLYCVVHSPFPMGNKELGQNKQ
jgi:hypothetical protein